MTESVTEENTEDPSARPEVARGRRPATSRQDVARAALELFARQGYDDTSIDEIAAAVGVSRRTFFRYYDSKPEVVWGEFDAELVRLRTRLEEAPADQPLIDVLRRAVMDTNRFGPRELEELRIRIGLTSTVPTLVAHSAVRYAEWCDVVAGFVAGRIGGSPDDLGPQTVARAALGVATAAFVHWSRSDRGDLVDEVDQAFRLLATGFDEERLPR
jgi:TetR/AcrR family transcriptional regulator, regulator of mycofactocin system